MIPSTGYVLIPLGLIIAFLPWRFCLIGLTIYGAMSAAAVINIGHFGLQPGYFLSIVLVGRAALEIMTRRFQLNAFVLGRLTLVFYLIIVSFVVLFIALCFFQGWVQCLPGTSSFDSAAVHNYHLSRENYTQILYLLINTSLVYIMGHYGAKRPVGELVRDWDVALACSLCFSAVVCLWQFTSFYSGLYYPSTFFYSNVGYGGANQTLLTFARLNGPFNEPSELGYVFTGFLLYAWQRYHLYPTVFTVGMIAVSVFCLIASTSTTAYLGLLVMAGVAGLDIVKGRIPLMRKGYRFNSGQITAIAMIVLGLVGGGIFAIADANQIQHVLQIVVFQKSESSSFHERLFADELGIKIFVQTYGIGLGLGSHKANSMIINMLSNVGIVGFLLLLTFAVTLLRPLRVQFMRSASAARKLLIAVRPFQWYLLGLLIINAFSAPNLSEVMLWLGVGGIIAIEASLRQGAAAVQSRVFSIRRGAGYAGPALHRPAPF